MADDLQYLEYIFLSLSKNKLKSSVFTLLSIVFNEFPMVACLKLSPQTMEYIFIIFYCLCYHYVQGTQKLSVKNRKRLANIQMDQT